MTRKGIELGFEEIAMAVLALIILIIIAFLIIGIVEPGSESASIFGRRASEVIK